MVDITLSSDRIRTAPIEVRRWIENELADSLGMRAATPPSVHHEHLVICTQDELARIFDFVGGMPPVAQVLAALGRNAGSHLPANVVMTPLADVADVAHLQGASQVIACVKIINDALQELRGDADVLVCAVDEEERCYVASETQAAIREAWHAIVAAAVRDAAAGMKAVRPTCAPPYSVVAAPAASSDQPAAN